MPRIPLFHVNLSNLELFDEPTRRPSATINRKGASPFCLHQGFPVLFAHWNHLESFKNILAPGSSTQTFMRQSVWASTRSDIFFSLCRWCNVSKFKLSGAAFSNWVLLGLYRDAVFPWSTHSPQPYQGPSMSPSGLGQHHLSHAQWCWTLGLQLRTCSGVWADSRWPLHETLALPMSPYCASVRWEKAPDPGKNSSLFIFHNKV